jgi:hypothetical protein
MKTQINKIQIIFLLIIVLAVGMLFATPTIQDKPEMPEAGSYNYITTNLNAMIGETYSSTWDYLSVDNCYDEHFAVWADSNLFSSYSPNDFTVTQEFGTGDTAMLTAGDIQVNRKVIPNGVDSFKIEYTITNNGDQIEDLRLFQVLDYDIRGRGNDYACYVSETDWIWMIDEDHYQCGYSGDIPSTRHGSDYWDIEIYDDYLDGELNNQDKYPESGIDDAGTGLQWNLGSLSTGSSTSVTVTFWFGVSVGENAPPEAQPILCIDPDPPSHDFGNVHLGGTRTWTFDITNCGKGIMDWTVSDDQTWISIGPTSGTTTTETDTITVTIDTRGLTRNTEHTGTITVNSDGGSKTGTIRVYVVYPNTVEPMLNTYPVPCAADAYVRSSNLIGTEKNVFAQGENVYCYAGDLPANDPAVDIYVVPNREWFVNDPIGSDVGDGVETVSTNGSGIIDVTLIWIAPLIAGDYDIIVDVDQDGVLDACEPINSFTIEVVFGEIPEFPTLAIPIISILCLVFIFQRRKK